MNKENKRKTIGEELWLVHLKRYQASPEDFDIVSPRRKRSKSIGEELYEVHLKRCHGLDLGCDYDSDCNGIDNYQSKKEDHVKVVGHDTSSSETPNSSDESIDHHVKCHESKLSKESHNSKVPISP
eukprot:49892_1